MRAVSIERIGKLIIKMVLCLLFLSMIVSEYVYRYRMNLIDAMKIIIKEYYELSESIESVTIMMICCLDDIDMLDDIVFD